jgi:hypothetical protein
VDTPFGRHSHVHRHAREAHLVSHTRSRWTVLPLYWTSQVSSMCASTLCVRLCFHRQRMQSLWKKQFRDALLETRFVWYLELITPRTHRTCTALAALLEPERHTVRKRCRVVVCALLECTETENLNYVGRDSIPILMPSRRSEMSKRSFGYMKPTHILIYGQDISAYPT